MGGGGVVLFVGWVSGVRGSCVFECWVWCGVVWCVLGLDGGAPVCYAVCVMI